MIFHHLPIKKELDLVWLKVWVSFGWYVTVSELLTWFPCWEGEGVQGGNDTLNPMKAQAVFASSSRESKHRCLPFLVPQAVALDRFPFNTQAHLFIKNPFALTEEKDTVPYKRFQFVLCV